MVGVIFVVVIVGLFVGAIVAQRAESAKVRPVWQGIHRQLDQPVPEFGKFFQVYKLDAEIDGMRVHAQQMANKSSRWVPIKVTYPSLGLGLKLRPEGNISSQVKVVPLVGGMLVGGTDIQIGEPQFDHQFLVSGHDPSEIIEFLTANKRAMLTRLPMAFPGVKDTDTQILWILKGTPPTGQSVVRPVQHFIRAAKVLHGGDEGLEQAVASLAGGDLEAGVQQLEQIQGPMAPEARLIEAEVLASGGGSPEKVQQVLTELDAMAGDDPELLALHSHVDNPATHEVVDSWSSATGAESGGQLGQLAELFGSNMYDGRAMFEARYQDRVITWEGTVRKVTPFVNDLDFGSGPALKALIGVGGVQSEYGNVEIDAVVAFPEGASVNEGSQVTFSGTLIKLDGFSRNVFVANGSLAT